MDKFNSKAIFPFTYGDIVENDDERLSESFVNLIQDARFHRILFAALYTAYIIGSYSTEANAMPPEAGEAINEALEGMEKNPIQNVPANRVAGNVNPQQLADAGMGRQVAAAMNQPMKPTIGAEMPQRNQYMFHGTQHNYGTPPGRGPKYVIPGPPTSKVGETVNTIGLAVGVGWICINAFWGNPVFAWGCVGIMTRLLFEIEKNIF